MLFREGETQAPEGNELVSRVDTAAPGDSTHCRQEPRGRDGKMLPEAPLFVLSGDMSPGLQKGILEIRSVELQPANKRVSTTPQNWTPRLWGVTPPWPATDQGDLKSG